MKPGIYENIPYEEYDAIPAYRSHDLTTVIKCPYSWKHRKALTETPALLEGRVQHTVFLEKHNFDKEFIISFFEKINSFKYFFNFKFAFLFAKFSEEKFLVNIIVFEFFLK